MHIYGPLDVLSYYRVGAGEWSSNYRRIWVGEKLSLMVAL